MNRKNLTAALLAGLAGAAGIAGSAQAVNLNPDGLGSVLIYPYYTVNGGNDTLLSVVNTTDEAKAVKVRFLESYNSREVLDFNLYMSAYDVWVAAIVAGQSAEDEIVNVPAGEDGAWLLVNDTSCTVPYLYELGPQAFLPYAYTGANADGGPTALSRVREGHFEMIEMGTLVGASAVDATHSNLTGEPTDCAQLVKNWSTGGIWLNEAAANQADPDDDFDDCSYPTDTGHCDYATTDVVRNSGGLFGTGALINGLDGTFFTYDAKAIQGWDDKDRGNHHTPGTSRPSLNSGNQTTSYVFFGEPITEAVRLKYPSNVDAVSSVFMHELIMNEYSVNPNVGARSEWVITFPTKNFYVDNYTRNQITDIIIPNVNDPDCNGWVLSDGIPNDGKGKFIVGGPDDGELALDWPGGLPCSEDLLEAEGRAPFTSEFNGVACEEYIVTGVWDREESPSTTTGRGPIVSPPPPGNAPPGGSVICYETNVFRWANDPTPDDGTEIFGSPASKSQTLAPGFNYDGTPARSGWAQISFWNPATRGTVLEHIDAEGLIGLPVTGFWALAVVNAFVGDNNVIANYGGLFGHKANIRRDGNCWSRWGNYCGSGRDFN
jgi:hypothetical protein